MTQPRYPKTTAFPHLSPPFVVVLLSTHIHPIRCQRLGTTNRTIGRRCHEPTRARRSLGAPDTLPLHSALSCSTPARVRPCHRTVPSRPWGRHDPAVDSHKNLRAVCCGRVVFCCCKERPRAMRCCDDAACRAGRSWSWTLRTRTSESTTRHSLRSSRGCRARSHWSGRSAGRSLLPRRRGTIGTMRPRSARPSGSSGLRGRCGAAVH